MLPGLEAKRVAQLGRNFEADRIGLGGLGHDLGDAQRVEMLGHHLPGRVGVGARQELHDREQMAEMLAVVPAPSAEDRPLVRGHLELGFGRAPPRSPSDIRPRTRADRAQFRDRSAACSVSSTSNSSGTKRQHQSSPSAMRRALSSVPSPSRIVHSDASSR